MSSSSTSPAQPMLTLCSPLPHQLQDSLLHSDARSPVWALWPDLSSFLPSIYHYILTLLTQISWSCVGPHLVDNDDLQGSYYLLPLLLFFLFLLLLGLAWCTPWVVVRTFFHEWVNEVYSKTITKHLKHFRQKCDISFASLPNLEIMGRGFTCSFGH